MPPLWSYDPPSSCHGTAPRAIDLEGDRGATGSVAWCSGDREPTGTSDEPVAVAPDRVVKPNGPSWRRPLVVAGVPRSGTTWAMRALEGDPSVLGLMEPDNESRSAPAIWAKRRIGRFPALPPGESNADYRRLWSWILDGAPEAGRLRACRPLLRAVRPAGRRRFYQGRISPLMQLAGLVGARPPLGVPGLQGERRLMVKTVHVPLALDWLADQFDIDVLVLLRNPANVLASWISLDLNDQFARLDERPAVRAWVEGGRSLRPVPTRSNDWSGRSAC